MRVILTASISEQIVSWYDQIGPWFFYLAVWGLVFAGTGLLIGAFIPFITGDSLVFAAGLVASAHPQMDIWVMAIGVGIAAWLGDQVGYTLGRHFGCPYIEKHQGKWVKAAVARSEKIYQAWGWWAVVVARFIPWARVFVPVIAGIARMNYYKFFSANLVGAIAWGSGLSVAGYFAASIPAVKSASYGIAIFFILGSIVAGVRAWLKNRKEAGPASGQ